MRVEVHIPGPPVPWQRAIQKHGGMGRFTPEAMRKYKRHVRRCAESALLAQHRGRWDTRLVYDVEIRMFFPDYKNRDDDNVEKVIKDACQKVLWHTDKWTQFRCITKWPTRDRDNPRVEMTVEVVER